MKINSLQMKETKAEQTQTHERVFADRQYAVDATIVRIMKTRKTMTHSELMSQVIEHLRFPATFPDIKKRVESLIEREYMERSEDDQRIYNYLA